MMKSNTVVSPFNYFGGKNKMSSIISEMLPYDTEYYIEPFGGAASVLLQKPTHPVEIYSDSSKGLCDFFNLLSKEDTARELIRRIYDTEYSLEEFKRAMDYRNSFDDMYLNNYGKTLKTQ